MSIFKIVLFQIIVISSLFGNININFNDNYSRQIKVLKKLDLDISFMYDEKLIEYINYYQQKNQKLYFFNTIQKASVFLPTIQRMLYEANVPNEFLYLAMAESEFSNNAVSHSSATGMWQFMSPTAKAFGLRIDTYVDERRDVIKSTDVAIKYLKSLYNKFGKWYLAAIAYNCGEGRLRRAIKKIGIDELEILLDEDLNLIPLESRNYIRKIVALAFLGYNEDAIVQGNFAHLLNQGSTFSLAIVSVIGGESLERVSKILNISEDYITKLNPHINYGLTPPDQDFYSIYIPYSRLARFKTYYRVPKTRQKIITHKVEKGESFYAIGKKYNCNYQKIQKFNNLDKNTLHLGQKLLIPMEINSNLKYSHNSQGHQTLEKISKKSDDIIYLVKKGDTLHSIARSFETNIESIMRVNNLNSQLIRIGEKLIVTR